MTIDPITLSVLRSALAGIGNATTPLAAVFFALALLPSDRLSPRKLAAVVSLSNLDLKTPFLSGLLEFLCVRRLP